MEPIQEEDEDCFSTNKTHAKHELGGGTVGLNCSRGQNSLGAKSDISISDFSKANDKQEYLVEGAFKVITERTEEAETSRLEGSQTSIKVNAKGDLAFSFKKERAEAEASAKKEGRDLREPKGSVPLVSSGSSGQLRPANPSTQNTIKDSQKTAKRGTKLLPADRPWAMPRYTPTHQPLREKSQDRRFRSGEKDLWHQASRSRSNCETERKKDVKLLRDSDWKARQNSKKFFKSFRDILQKHGHPGSLFNAKTMKTVEAIEARAARERTDPHSEKDHLSPDIIERSLELPRKSKSFLKLK